MSDITCHRTNASPTWGTLDLAIWKLAPRKLGGGIGYLQRFKDAWVRHNRQTIGPVSIQLRTAAETMGLNPAQMSVDQLRQLSICLQKDVFNIELVARHLRQLIDRDGLQTTPPLLTSDAVRIVGARYNRGIGLSLDEIRKNTSYGNFIVKFWPRFQTLLQEPERR